MAVQWSLVVSEAALLACCALAAQELWPRHALPAYGIGIIAFASLLGLLRFAGFANLLPIHRFFSDAGSAVALPLVAAALANSARGGPRAFGVTDVQLAVALVLLFLTRYGAAPGKKGALFDTVMALASLATFAYYGGENGQVGAALVLVATGLMEAKARIEPFLMPEDFFHYVFGPAIVLIARAFAGGRLRLSL